MKKKITAIFLCIALAATAIVGASLAYFTDTDNETNTFTVGNVKIDLQEGTKKDLNNGTVNLTNWQEQKAAGNAALMPGTSSDGNAVSKIVTVKNTGANDAWVWVEIKVPTALISTDIQNASEETFNALHWNSYGHFTTAYNSSGKYTAAPIADGIIDADGKVLVDKMVAVKDGLWNDFEYVGIDGNYTVFRATMEKTLASGQISLPCLRQVYMDWRLIANDDGSYTFPETQTDKYHYDEVKIPADTSWEIIVNAFAIQADGISSVDNAVKLYESSNTGTTTHPTDADVTKASKSA